MFRAIMRTALVVAGVIVLCAASCRQLPSPEERDLAAYPTGLTQGPEVRVLVLDNQASGTLTVTGPYQLEVVHRDGRRETGGGRLPVAVGVTPTAGGVRLGRDEVRTADIIPGEGTHLTFESGKAKFELPGKVHLYSQSKADGPRLCGVVSVGIEEYLVGVVAGEMPSSWPAEALRAQAVASRTFALYMVKTRARKDYDVKTTVMSQVWVPSRRADPRVLLAVNSTRGQVLTHEWALFPTYFHSECGGRTANAKHVFLQREIWPLSGVDCPFCLGPEKPRGWERRIDRRTLSARLAAAGLIAEGRQISQVEALDQDGTSLRTLQRVYSMRLRLDNGVEKTVSADEFRRAVGYERKNLPSTFFAVSHTANDIVLEGRGYGHGVGLCQYGAAYLARQGQLYPDILAHYYPGAKLLRLWND